MKCETGFIRREGVCVRRLFHGTATDFDVFDVSRAGTIKTSDWGKGIYFDVSRHGAEYYRQEAVVESDEDVATAFNKLKAIERTLKPVSRYDSTPDYTDEYDKALEEFRSISSKVRAEPRGRVIEASIKPSAKVYKHIYEAGMITDPLLAERIKDDGYDVIEVWDRDGKEEWISEVVVINPKVIVVD